MPASQTSVVNAALRILGAKRVASIDADVRTAKVMKDAYDDALEEVLGMHQWKFADTREELPALVTDPEFGWENAYQLPADCIMPREVEHAGPNGYKVEGTQIFSNIGPPLQLLYTKRETDMTVWHALARKCLSAHLAAETAETITGTLAQVEKAHAILRDALSKARPVDGQQDSPRQVEASQWLDSRGVQGPFRTNTDDLSEPL